MLKKSALLKREFKRVLPGVLLSYIIVAAGEFIDYIIAGRAFGEMAVAAVSLVNPLYEAFAGIALMISMGFSVVYSNEEGKSDKSTAEKLYCESVLIAVGIGIICCIASCLFTDTYFAICGCGPQLEEYCYDYYKFYPFVGLIYPLFYVQIYKCENDGDAKRLVISAAVGVVVHLAVSLSLMDTMGIEALGLGTLISIVAQILVMFMNMFNKNTAIEKFYILFRFKDFFSIIKHGFFGLISYALIALVDIFFNAYIIHSFGEIYVSLYALINFIYNFAIIFEAVTSVGVAVTGVYYGENNSEGVRNSVVYLVKLTLMVGGIISLAFVLGAKYVPYLYGLVSPEIYPAAVFTSIVVGAMSILIAVSYIPIDVYSCIGHPGLGVMYSIIYSGIMPIISGVGLSLLFGYKGLIVGLALYPPLTLLTGAIITRLIKGRKGFPLYLKLDDYRSFLYVTDKDIEGRQKALDALEEDLLRSEINRDKAKRVRLMAEETLVKIAEINPQKDVVIELSVIVSGDEIRLVTRDDGEISDIYDPDQKVSSLNTMVLSLMMGQHSVENMITSSINRNTVTFDID